MNLATSSSIKKIQKTQTRFYDNNFFIAIFYISGIFMRPSLDLGRES